ncbi:MAG TPA: NADH-quinone oxidoreductase subunit C [Thermoplasmata archaeon]|nr:NADH-quinone oxidoreductase subunit C [Thermoplasmata archaeon]
MGAHFLGAEPFAGTAGRVRFARDGALALFRAARDDLGFAHLSMVGAIDWVDRREVFYVVWSDRDRQYALLSTDLPATDAHVETASAIWPSANWHEREAWEMVGVLFDHHPDLRHLLTPDGYAFHPLLRSFKLHEPEELEVKTRHV